MKKKKGGTSGDFDALVKEHFHRPRVSVFVWVVFFFFFIIKNNWLALRPIRHCTFDFQPSPSFPVVLIFAITGILIPAMYIPSVFRSCLTSLDFWPKYIKSVRRSTPSFTSWSLSAEQQALSVDHCSGHELHSLSNDPQRYKRCSSGNEGV